MSSGSILIEQPRISVVDICCGQDTGGGGVEPGPGIDTTAIHVDQSNEIAPIALKSQPEPGDVLVIENSRTGFGKNSVDVDGVDVGAVHWNVANEFLKMPLKNTPVPTDVLMINDDQDGGEPKRISAQAFLQGGTGEANDGLNLASGTQVFVAKQGVNLTFNVLSSAQFAVTLNTINIAPNAIGSVELAGSSVDTGAIIDDSVTNAKLADMTASTIKGAVITGDPVDLTATEVRSIINVEDGATAGDADALHLSVADELSTNASVTYDAGLRLYVEDPRVGLAPRWVAASTLTSGGGGEINTATNLGGGLAIAYETNQANEIPIRTLDTSQFTEATDLISIAAAFQNLANADQSLTASRTVDTGANTLQVIGTNGTFDVVTDETLIDGGNRLLLSAPTLLQMVTPNSAGANVGDVLGVKANAAGLLEVDVQPAAVARPADGTTAADMAALAALANPSSGERVKVTTNRLWFSYTGSAWEVEDDQIKATEAEWAAITEPQTGQIVEISDSDGKGLRMLWNGSSWEALPEGTIASATIVNTENAWTAPQYYQSDAITPASNITIDVSSGSPQRTLTVNQDMQIGTTGWRAAGVDSIVLHLTQDVTGGHAITWVGIAGTQPIINDAPSGYTRVVIEAVSTSPRFI